MPDKVKLARLCLLVAGWLKIATAALFLFILLAGAVLIGRSSERSGLVGSGLLGGLGILFFAASAAIGTVDIIAAIAVKQHAAWGRGLGIVLGILMAPLFPVGTVLGIFILGGLMGGEARAWFSREPAGF